MKYDAMNSDVCLAVSDSGIWASLDTGDGAQELIWINDLLSPAVNIALGVIG